MDATGIDNAALVGVSLGAEIAAGFAAKCPGRVSRLALSAPTGLTPLYRGLQGIPLVVTSTYSLMAWSKDRYKRYAENMLYRIKPASGPIVWKEWKRMKDPAYRAVLVRNALNLSLVDPAFEASLGSIRAPTLLIWGRNDRVIPLTDATLYQDRIQGSDLVVLERCGHVPPLEQADAFISAFMTFLGREELYFGDESVGEQA